MFNSFSVIKILLVTQYISYCMPGKLHKLWFSLYITRTLCLNHTELLADLIEISLTLLKLFQSICLNFYKLNKLKNGTALKAIFRGTKMKMLLSFPIAGNP